MNKILQKLKKHIALARKAPDCAVTGSTILMVVKEGPSAGKEKQYYCYHLERHYRRVHTSKKTTEETNFRFGLILRSEKHLALTKVVKLRDAGAEFMYPPTLFHVDTEDFPGDLREELCDFLQGLWEHSAAKSLDLTYKLVS